MSEFIIPAHCFFYLLRKVTRNKPQLIFIFFQALFFLFKFFAKFAIINQLKSNMKKSLKRFLAFGSLFAGLILFSAGLLTSCGSGSNTSKADEETANKTDDAAFYETQPVHSGLYDASYYDITGKNPRKGQFDGRIYFSLSPETSAILVFENGNRTKIDVTIALQRPFEKNDSGFYQTVDLKERPVTVTPDSAAYILGFQHGGDDYKITFNPKPRHTGTALEILEKIGDRKKKN